MPLARLAVLLLATTLALACGGDEESIDTESGTFKVEAEEGGIRISGEEEGGGAISGQFGENAEVPAGFPEDAPVYPDASIVAGLIAGGQGMLTLRTGDDPSEVAAFYREKLAEEGWSLGSDMDLMGQRVLAVEKGDRNGAVQISREAGDTTIIIAIDLGG